MRTSAQKDPLASRTFWPRMTQPGLIAADYDQDRPCLNCGYNLRGLPPRQPCPECGSVGGLNLSDEPIPYDERPNLLGFFATIAMVVGRPHEMARQVWRPVRMNARAARRFRNISLTVAVLTIAAVTFVISQNALARRIAQQGVAQRAALTVALISIAASLVWLHGLTHALEAFIRRGNAPKPIEPRALAVALYPSATFALMPVQLILLLATTRAMPLLSNPLDWLAPAATHFALLVFSLLPGIIAAAWVVYELVDVTPPRAFALIAVAMIARLISGVILLIAVPAMAALLAANAFSR